MSDLTGTSMSTIARLNTDTEQNSRFIYGVDGSYFAYDIYYCLQNLSSIVAITSTSLNRLTWQTQALSSCL